MANVIKSPYPMFFEEDGRPVEGGHVYIGVSGLNPISNPLACYYDEAMTIPAAAKDIRISGGYITYKGAPRNLYVPGAYSLLVQDKNGSTIYSSLSNTATDADLLLTLPRGTMARAMRVPNAYNFNKIVESGFYSWTNGGTSNFPVGCAAADLYALQVEASPDGTGIIYQRLVDFSTGPTSALYTFERQSINAGVAWSPWIATNIPSGYGIGWQSALAQPFSSQVIARGYIDGLTCSNAADTDHDITIAAGKARDATDVLTLTLAAAITKRIDEAWAPGNNAGGMLPGGALVANSVYYLRLFRKDSDGSTDCGFQQAGVAIVLPAGYTYSHRIMSVCTDAAANIIPFTQTGDEVIFNNAVTARAVATAGSTNRLTITTPIPPNVVGLIEANAYHTSDAGLAYVWVDSSLRTDAAATNTNYSIILQNSGANGIIKPIKINGSRQIFARASHANIAIGCTAIGWIDDRGRNA